MPACLPACVPLLARFCAALPPAAAASSRAAAPANTRAPRVPPARTAQDRARCDELYAQTKASVEEGIQWLLEKRGSDPFGEFLPRQLYEQLNRGRQAPTFPLN